GLKWASVLTAAAVPAALCLLLHRMGTPWPGLFALLAWTGALIMPGRLLMLRAQNVAIVGVALALWCLATRRHRILALVSFAMMQAYHGAVLLLPLAMLDLGIRRVREEVWAWKPLLAVVVGLCAGLLLSPWFPENVDYLLFHTLYKLTNPQHLAVGSEWQSPSVIHILRESWPVLTCLVLAIIIRARRRQGWPGHEIVLWGAASLLCLLLYLKAWRFAEYFVPVAAIFTALLIRDDGKEQEGAPEPARAPSMKQDNQVRLLLVITAICIAAGGWLGMRTVADRAEFEPAKYGEIAKALGADAQRGDMVFNRAWEDFVFLFWQRSDLRYVTGLDPNYLAYEDPARFQLWMWIRGISPDE
ncbi:MAG: hypothetical protein VX938_05220, partial [Myxococcota bacterium]|nr:hypothetical protein [Myxococcota bacterium]